MRARSRAPGLGASQARESKALLYIAAPLPLGAPPDSRVLSRTTPRAAAQRAQSHSTAGNERLGSWQVEPGPNAPHSAL